MTDEAGHGAVAQTCAGGFCGISVITGRRSAADAERDIVRDCNKQYGVNNCYALDRWQETAAAPVAKAPLSNPPQPKPPMSASGRSESATGKGLSAAQRAQMNAALKLSGEEFKRAIAKLDNDTFLEMMGKATGPGQSVEYMSEFAKRGSE